MTANKESQQLIDLIIYFLGISVIIAGFIMGCTGELNFTEFIVELILGMLIIIYAHMRGQNNK